MKAIETLQEYSNLAGPVFLRPQDIHTPQQTAAAEWVLHGGMVLSDDGYRRLFQRLHELHYSIEGGGIKTKYCIGRTARDIALECPRCGGHLAKMEFEDEYTHGVLVFCLDCLEEIYVFSSEPKRLLESVIRYDAEWEMAGRINELNELDLATLKIDSSLLKRLTDGGLHKIGDIWWDAVLNGLMLDSVLNMDALRKIGIGDEKQEEALQIKEAIMDARNKMMEEIVHRLESECKEDDAFGMAIIQE